MPQIPELIPYRASNFLSKILGYLLTACLLFSETENPDFNKKLIIEKSLEKRLLEIDFGAGTGFFFCKRPSSAGTISYHNLLRNYYFGFLFRYRDTMIYQGIDAGFFHLNAAREKTVKLQNATMLFNTSGFIISAAYPVTIRYYTIHLTPTSSWSIKKFYLGAGPGYFLQKIRETGEMISKNSGIEYNTDMLNHRLGVYAKLGIHFSLKQSGAGLGFDLRMYDIFSYPAANEKFRTWRIWSPIAFHQQIITFALMLAFDI
ncbi:MAG TPA: hypothetical protein DC049_02315 [Spirochaetia bacterium]|nr:hypothetical protein [Spirochaetia bacterium]